MNLAAYFGLALTVQLFAIGVAYGFYRDWQHCGYYISAAVLNTFVVSMGASK